MRTFLTAFLVFSGAAGCLWAAGPPVAAPDPDSIQDVLFMTDARPALVRLHLKANGKSFDYRWTIAVTRLFEFLDRDQDNLLDRDEAGRAPTPQALQRMMQGSIFTPAGGTTSLRELDANSDGKVTIDEFLAYYRNSVAGPLSVLPSYSYPGGADSLSAVLFDILDTDRDGKLSRAELEAAPKILRKYDQNDDELISAAELGGAPVPSGFTPVPAQPGGMRGGPASGAALVLFEKASPGQRMTGRLNVAREVINRYDRNKDGKLSLDEVGLPRKVFAQLDRNKDGFLDALEVLRWTTSKPDAEVMIDLNLAPRPGGAMREGGVGGGGGGVAPAMALPVSYTATVIDLDGTRINVVRSGGGYARSNASAYYLNLFRQGDKDGKGFVTREQVALPQLAPLRPLLDLADRDGDGKLTHQELVDGLDVLGKGVGTQLNLNLADVGQGLFRVLDANGDGQLSQREMRDLWSRLAEYDKDGDGYIGRTEFPRLYQLTIAQAGAYGAVRPPVAFAPGGYPPVVRPATARGPVWFHKMDRNGDGDLSPAEWLGTAEEFKRIDTDGDGLISVDEAIAADRAMRAKRK